MSSRRIGPTASGNNATIFDTAFKPVLEPTSPGYSNYVIFQLAARRSSIPPTQRCAGNKNIVATIDNLAIIHGATHMDSSFQSRNFPTTLWTVVLHAGRDEPAQARAALAQLCQAYWYPLYSFVRRRGYSPHDAEDLAQAFFTQLLENRGLGRADPEQGRFRTFLLASLKNFLANDWDRSQALKRGGGQTIVSLDDVSAESRYQLEPNHDMTPDRHFERQWAMTLLEQVLDALRDEYHAEGKGDLFEELKVVITGQPAAYADMAARLRRSEGAIKVAAHRMRHRYRMLMRARIAETVGEGDVEDELRHLLAVLSG
jgi:RNA polymerase sigma-70 factor (ECF subfamily)